MKREDITDIFPDATKEQIDSILNKSGSELTALNGKLADMTTKFNDASSNLTEANESLTRMKTENEDLKAKVEAGMTAEQLLEQREKEAADREREFTIKNNTLDARSIFQDAGFSAEEVEELIPQVVSEDADKTKALATQIVNLTKSQREQAAQAKQDELLKSNPQLGGASSGEGGGMTREQFNKLSFAEQLKLKEENPSILNSLA